MADQNQNNFTNPELWIRLVYMVVFAILAALARYAIAVTALIQFLVVLFTGSDNDNLRRFGDSLASWMRQCYRFLSFASDQKPYPFQDWPQPEETDVDPSAAAPTSEVEPAPAPGAPSAEPASEAPSAEDKEPSAEQEPSAKKEPSAKEEPSAKKEPSADKEPSEDADSSGDASKKES